MGSTREGLHLLKAPLLPKLRGHFAEFLSERSLERLRIFSSPTCVGLRYGHLVDSLEVFLGSVGSTSLRGKAPPRNLSGLNEVSDLPKTSPYWLEPGHPSPGWPTLLRHPITQAPTRRYGNINPFPITYAFRPRLRGRLTLRGLTLRRKPWAYGEQACNLFYRYS